MNSGGNTSGRSVPPNYNVYKVSRLGKKLQITNDFKLLAALPRDVPERIWAETLQKEENDLIVLEMREEIFEEAMKRCYNDYFERQTVYFAAHCAAQAFVKLIDWCFFRHDPGEETTAYPPCYIPKRAESWVPDQLPDPSVKDTLCQQDLEESEEAELPDEDTRWRQSSSSVNLPEIPAIPEKCKFPGRVKLGGLQETIDETSMTASEEPTSDESYTPLEQVGADSEIIQKVTDYGSFTSRVSFHKDVAVNGSLHGAGDSIVTDKKLKLSSKNLREKKMGGRGQTHGSTGHHGRSHNSLPPLRHDSRSLMSIISDCRLRNLRLETYFDVTAENIESPPVEHNKRK